VRTPGEKRKAVGTMLKFYKRRTPQPVWKRGFDLAGAFCGLLVLSPLMLLISAHIKFASRGPVFFMHKRYGYGGKPIHVWKFRSMHVNHNPQDHQQHVLNLKQGNDVQLKKMDTDSQLIFLGKWIRASAIDELPQLFNVIRGEMSLVGPRPDVIPREDYDEWQKVRFNVLPGLTGLWQVSGKNNTTFNEMNRLDAQYVQSRSLMLDSKIVAMTLPAIFKQIVADRSGKKTGKSPAAQKSTAT
jgi:lipopolysaccharide/colanic/teichoic acid biosynthesis glycosyltransferase